MDMSKWPLFISLDKRKGFLTVYLSLWEKGKDFSLGLSVSLCGKLSAQLNGQQCWPLGYSQAIERPS